MLRLPQLPDKPHVNRRRLMLGEVGGSPAPRSRMRENKLTVDKRPMMQQRVGTAFALCCVAYGMASAAQQNEEEAVVLSGAERAAIEAVVLEVLANARPTRSRSVPIKLQLSPPDGATKSVPAPPGTGTTTLGYVSREIRADNPHVGSSTGNVKAKTESSCDYTHTNLLHPPPEDPFFRWTLTIALTDDAGATIASGDFVRQESDPHWPPNSTSSFWGGSVEGTQIDAGYCEDGTYTNEVVIWLSMVWPYNYADSHQPVAQGSRTADVECPGQ